MGVMQFTGGLRLKVGGSPVGDCTQEIHPEATQNLIQTLELSHAPCKPQTLTCPQPSKPSTALNPELEGRGTRSGHFLLAIWGCPSCHDMFESHTQVAECFGCSYLGFGV